MELSKKNKILIGIVVLAGTYAAGRLSAPEKIKIEKQEVVVKDTEKQRDKEVITDKKITTLPDGTKVEEVKIRENTKTVTTETEKKKTNESKLVQSGAGKVNISGLFGIKPRKLQDGLVYGVSVSTRVLGPVTIGIWGLIPEPVVGVSAGLQF